MKFEPLAFIHLARQQGITMTRIENNIKVIDADTLWIAAIKQHKRQLLKHLPDDQVKRLQVDLFDDEFQQISEG